MGSRHAPQVAGDGVVAEELAASSFLEEEKTMTEPDEAKNDIERKMHQGLGTDSNHQSHEVLNFHMTGQVGEDPTGTIWTIPVAEGPAAPKFINRRRL